MDLGAIRTFAAERGFEILRESALKPDRGTFQVAVRGRPLALKVFRAPASPPPLPVRVYEAVLPNIPMAVGRLRIPRVVDVSYSGEIGHFVLLEWLEGRDFHARWHVSKAPAVGGRLLGSELVELVVEMISDLKRLDAGRLERAGLRSIGRPEIWRSAERYLGFAEEAGWLGAEAAGRYRAWTARLADETSDRDLVVSNEDFRFANFVEIDPDQTGLVDWDGARCSRHEVEHCVAYLWLQMWNNTEWQRRLIRRSRESLGIEEDILRAVLLERTLAQAHTWRGDSSARQIQIRYFRDALDESRWQRIWNG